MEILDTIAAAIWSAITDAFIYIINLIPSPDFVDDVVTYINQFVAYASYPAYLSGIDLGLPMICSAYLIRFTIRRLPFIG